MILLYARTFIETYRCGSITKAAVALNITQPAASSHIKGLEAYIGKPLFYREGRGIKPTPMADDLARTLASPLDTIESALASTKSRSSLITGTVHISGPGEFVQFLASKAMVGLSQLGINLRIHTGGRDFVIDQIESNKTDLAILAHDYRSKSVDRKVIYTESLIPVATPDWASRNLVKPHSPEQFLDKPVIAYSEGLALIDLYFEKQCCQKCSTKATITVPDLRIVKEFVLNGEGYSVLPNYMCREELKTGTLINLYDHKANPENNIYLVWPKINLRDPRVVFVKDHLLKAF